MDKSTPSKRIVGARQLHKNLVRGEAPDADIRRDKVWRVDGPALESDAGRLTVAGNLPPEIQRRFVIGVAKHLTGVRPVTI